MSVPCLIDVFILLGIGVLVLFWKFPRKNNRFKKTINEFMLKHKFIVVGLTLISIDLLGDAVQGESLFKGWFEDFHIHYSSRCIDFFSIIILFLVAIGLLQWINREIGEGVIRVFEEKQSKQFPKKMLFFALSTQSNGILEKKGDNWTVTKYDKNSKAVDGSSIALSGNIVNDLEEFGKMGSWWNWLQILRGIKPHATLEEICILASRDKNGKGSYLQLDDCKSLLQLYLENIRITHIITDFSDMGEMSEDIRKTIGIIKDRKENKITDEEIIFDVTGGTKVVSIAMASITYSNSMSIQYIDNDANSSVHQINYVWVDL